MSGIVSITFNKKSCIHFDLHYWALSDHHLWELTSWPSSSASSSQLSLAVASLMITNIWILLCNSVLTYSVTQQFCCLTLSQQDRTGRRCLSLSLSLSLSHSLCVCVCVCVCVCKIAPSGAIGKSGEGVAALWDLAIRLFKPRSQSLTAGTLQPSNQTCWEHTYTRTHCSFSYCMFTLLWTHTLLEHNLLYTYSQLSL